MRNEAAERLHDLATASEFEWDEAEWDRTLDAALATERRLTVERIRELLVSDEHSSLWDDAGWRVSRLLSAALDELGEQRL